MKGKLTRRSVTVAGVTAAATMAFAGTAFAGSNSPTANHYNSNDIVDASAKFYTSGDQVYVKDNYADGHSAVAEIWASGVGTFRVWANGGSGTSTTRSIDFPEGITVHLRACIGESGSGDILSCSPYVEGVA